MPARVVRVWCERETQKSLSCVRLCDTMDFSRPGCWRGQPVPSPEDRPNPGIEPRSPPWQANALPAEPRGKPESTGVGSLSLLQRTFPTQESHRGLLHCGRALYQLSHQGSPRVCLFPKKSPKWLHHLAVQPAKHRNSFFSSSLPKLIFFLFTCFLLVLTILNMKKIVLNFNGFAPTVELHTETS